MNVVVLCPTRGRPDNAWEVAYSIERTRMLPSTNVLFILDEDDPKLDEYLTPRADETLPVLVAPPGLEKGMVAALNWGADRLLRDLPETILVGFVGDDHRFRTKGWDAQFVSWVKDHPVSIVYANDGARIDIPTQVFMTSNIISALGWMAPPVLRHLYVDNAWRDLGVATSPRTIHCFQDLLIEHMHPAFQKAKMDEGYARVNSGEMYGHDGAAYGAWVQGEGFKDAVAAIQALL